LSLIIWTLAFWSFEFDVLEFKMETPLVCGEKHDKKCFGLGLLKAFFFHFSH
jgi:hypothetical protein